MGGYLTLPLYYKINFNLMQHHKYNLSDVENMYPFERDIYLELLNDFIEKQNKAAENN